MNKVKYSGKAYVKSIGLPTKQASNKITTVIGPLRRLHNKVRL